MAHKKAAWSAKNLKNSNPQYRWVKLFWWQVTKAGNVIIRQKWEVYVAWENTYMWRDFTIHASVDGKVAFRKKNIEKFNGRKYQKTIVEVATN